MLANEETTKLIHRNLAIIATFAFSRPSIVETLDQHFKGEWAYLRKSVYSMAERRADRALVEMATQIRILDDAEHISDYLRHTNQEADNAPRLGRLIKADQTEEPLWLRDFTNKVIHANRIEWQFDSHLNPLIITYGNDQGRWLRAEISVIALMSFTGTLMH
ncbi:MAG: hypothetical protein C6Y20_10600 [Tagaea sp. CACIAM 22H2]|nr:hypothetical protein [Tagaea sp. CACIAM 22H2]